MRIMLVEDHEPTRREMRALIERQSDLSVVAEADSGELAMRTVDDVCPDIIVMDIALPGINGVETTRSITGKHPEIRVLALSNYSGEALVDAVLHAGGHGYVRKDQAFEELIPAIRMLATGKNYLQTEY